MFTATVTAFLGGLISFLSPCVLPLVPAYQAFLIGVAPSHIRAQPQLFRRQLLGNTAAFCAGFTLVFMLLGAAAAGINAALLQYKTALSWWGGLFVLLLGVHVLLAELGWPLLRILQREKRLNIAPNATRGYATSLLAGIAFACGWTPCIGPVLAGILTLAAQQQQALAGMMLLLCYAAGLAVPFLLSAAFSLPFLAFLQRFKGALRGVNIVAALLLMGTGTLMMLDSLGRVGNALLFWLPALARLG